MKALDLQMIDGYEIMSGVSTPAIDPEETRARIDLLLSENPDLRTMSEDDLYLKYAVPVHGTTNQRVVEDTVGKEFEALLSTLSEHEKILSSGTIIADWRGKEFWTKGQKWEKRKIEHLGESLPENGFFESDLTAIQRTEIQQELEQERISKLTPEQKAQEKDGCLKAAKREASLLKSDADIAGEQFDAPAWFQTKKAEIEAKYSD
ncbi:MAG: hypothetical protein LBU00_05250 [Treponema sp.]|jgi:phage gpG-like protein|nr:hypothetical protein [Treponema sp.]